MRNLVKLLILLILLVLITILIKTQTQKERYEDYEVTTPPITDSEATSRAKELIEREVRLIRELEPYYSLYATIIAKYYMKKPLREVEDKIVASDLKGEVYPLSQGLRAIEYVMRQQQPQSWKYIIDVLPLSVTVYQTTVKYLIDRANELLEDLSTKSTDGGAAVGLPARTIKLLSKTTKVQTADYMEYLKTTEPPSASGSIKLYQIMKSRDSRYSELTSMPSLLVEVRNLYSKLASLEAQLYSE